MRLLPLTNLADPAQESLELRRRINELTTEIRRLTVGSDPVPVSPHTHGGGDITSAVANATNAINATNALTADSANALNGKVSTEFLNIEIVASLPLEGVEYKIYILRQDGNPDYIYYWLKSTSGTYGWVAGPSGGI